MTARETSAQPLSPTAVRRAVRDWLLAEDDQVSPVLIVTASQPEALAALFDEALGIWRARVRGGGGGSDGGEPGWARWTADGVFAPDSADETYAGRLLDLAGSGGVPADTRRPGPGLLVVDDLDELRARVSRAVAKAARPRPDPRTAGVRLLLGAATGSEAIPEELDPRTKILTRAHIHPRTAAHDRIVAWARDPGAPEILLVKGPSGAGKTVLLRQVLDTLAEDDRVDMAFDLLRDSESDLRPLTTPALVAGLRRALEGEGAAVRLSDLFKGPVTANVTARNVTSSITGISIVAGSADPSLDQVLSWFENRPGRPAERRQLVVLVDALNELNDDPRADLGGLRTLIAAIVQRGRSAPSGPGWGVKVLLSSTETPSWLSPSRTVDLTGPEVDEEIRAYALDRLLGGSVPASAEGEIAQQVVQHSGGLFIVASGSLDVWEDEGRLPEPSEDAVPSAVRHFEDRFDRLRTAVNDSGDDRRMRDWADIARVLTIAALFPQGLTERELAGIWTARTGDPVGTEWTVSWPEDLPTRLASGPARQFLVFPGPRHPDARVRVRHASIRDAVLAGAEPREAPDGSLAVDPARLVPRPGIGMTAELERFVVALTPLEGGPGWDAVHRRLAVALVPDVLTRLLGRVLGDRVDARGSRDRVMGWLRALVEDWSWWESFIGAHEDAELPLGLPRLERHLTALVAVPRFDAAAVVLWPDGLPPVQLPENGQAERRRPVPPTRGPRPTPKRTHYASLRYPSVRAVVEGQYRFPTRDQALAQLRIIATTFTQSRQLCDLEDDGDVSVLWITGYALLPEETRRGVRGHYARVRVARRDDAWTLLVEPVETMIKPPVQDRPPPNPRTPRDAPNWGHPVLRRVRRNSRTPAAAAYPTWAAAQRDLDVLRDEFPKVAIPTLGRLYTLVWEGGRRERGLVPTVRYVMSIEECEGGYLIRAQLNEQRGDGDRPPAEGGA
ncbi:ATP-binding protein [Streptomyces sp. NPDC049970]|uniref:ATP-binding protein n=1 Tax=Streptomyces sp. NPDC049970 TaxID=3155033 RepID=UPI00341E2940